MFHKITALFGLILTIPSNPSSAWDSPLPFLAQPSGTGLAAFSNPASATRLEDAGYGFALSHPDSAEGLWERRVWSAHYQEAGQALGMRVLVAGAPAQADLGWTLGRDLFGWLSTGARLGYFYREGAPDGLDLDAGLQLRPHPALLAGYWGRNLLTSRAADQANHLSFAVKPFAFALGRSRELSLGYGKDIPREGSSRDFIYLQSPLPLLASTAQVRWDLEGSEISAGLTMQLSSRISGAVGMSAPEGGTSEGDRVMLKETAVRGHRRQKIPYLFRDGRVAVLDLNHAFTEGETERSFLAPSGEVGFLDLKRRMDVIEADPGVTAVIVKLGRARAGWGMGEEIRGRLKRFRAGGRRVVAYMEEATPLNYYLASAADLIAMQPGGHFAVSGFSSEMTFYRGFFEKVGVEPQFLRHGKYKSFEEPFTRKGMSPEARANLEAYLASMWSYYLDAVSEGRKLGRASMERALASGDIGLGHALQAGLIDTLVDQDQVLELAGGKGASLRRENPEDVHRGNWEIPPRIGLVVVQGDLVMGRSSQGWLGTPELAGAESVARQLKRARLDPGIRAVVLRVESPGGSAQAADIMAREVELIRKAGKPIVASIGHMAASGGYYLVCGADRIYSAHNSAVGSIGILWGKFVLTGLYHKLGLTTETVKTAPHADANSLSRPWDSTEVALLQSHMDAFYDRFISKVAAGRRMSKAAVDSLAQGRIFTGSEAVAVKLVDAIGGLDDAVREAARRAGIPAGRAVELDPITGRQGRSWAGRDRAGRAEAEGMDLRPETGLAALSRWAEHYRGLAEGQLWALSPELAGWTTEDSE